MKRGVEETIASTCLRWNNERRETTETETALNYFKCIEFSWKHYYARLL